MFLAGMKCLWKEDGASTFFDTADEVLILLAITVDDEYEKGTDLVKKTLEKLDKVTESYEMLKEEHIQDFQKIYNRVSLSLGSEKPLISTDSLLKKSVDNNTASPALLEKMFNMSRYLAISSGRPSLLDNQQNLRLTFRAYGTRTGVQPGIVITILI